MNIVLCVCSIFLKEFEGKLRVFSQLRVTVNNERVSSGKSFSLVFISSLCTISLLWVYSLPVWRLNAIPPIRRYAASISPLHLNALF